MFMSKEWLKKKESFEVMDVRELKGNFLPMILKKADKIEEGDGICIVQSFEPIPLYSVMADLGFEYHTEQAASNEYRVYFYRKEVKKVDSDLPLKPTAIVNFNHIDPELANLLVNFWHYIWGREEAAIDMKTRLLLSLSNAVGAGRLRQATRELIKAYSIGVSTKEFDELFAMFVWNQGVGHFASQIGPSALFAAYRFIKEQEKAGTNRSEIVGKLMEKYGEKNPEVATVYKK